MIASRRWRDLGASEADRPVRPPEPSSDRSTDWRPSDAGERAVIAPTVSQTSLRAVAPTARSITFRQILVAISHAMDNLLAPQSPSIRCGPNVPRSQNRRPIGSLPRSRKQGGRTVGGRHLLQHHARILGWRALPARHHEASAAYCLPRRPNHFHHHNGKRSWSAAGAFGHFREMAHHDRNGKLRWREIVIRRSMVFFAGTGASPSSSTRIDWLAANLRPTTDRHAATTASNRLLTVSPTLPRPPNATLYLYVLRCLAWVATISVWKHEIEFGCEQVNHGFEVAD